MRVIAGDFKGRQLKAVRGTNTRPTSDKIKESVFHKLGPFFEGGFCLDLFAGSGSLGIEAISRGMDKVIFVEQSSAAVKVIYKNVELLKTQAKCDIYRNDAYRALHIMHKKKMKFNLILLDPPYKKGNYQKLIHQIEKLDLLASYGQLYVEHSPEETVVYEPKYFRKLYEKKYNTTTSITILQKEM